MVVRKPTPAGAFRPSSSSHSLPRDPSFTLPSNEIPTRVPNAPQHPAPDPYRTSKPRQNPHNEVPRSFSDVSGNTERPYIDEEDQAEKALPAILQTCGTNRSLEELEAELPDSRGRVLTASEKATPRSSLESARSRDFWEDDLQPSGHVNNCLKRSAAQSTAPSTTQNPLVPVFYSTNPFRRNNSSNGSVASPGHSLDGNGDGQGKGREVNPPETPIEMTANLSLADRPFAEYSTSYRPSTLNLNETLQEKGAQHIHQMPLHSSLSEPSLPPSAPLSLPRSPFENTIDNPQPSLIPISMENPEDIGISPSDSGLSNGSNGAAQESSMTRWNVRSTGLTGLEKRLPLPLQAYAPSRPDPVTTAGHPVPIPHGGTTSSQSTVFQEPHVQDYPPLQPPRSKSSLSRTVEAEMARLREQRNETYQIKHFNWFDHNSRALRRSSMLTQNKNGPCPLLALVNALILGGENDSRSALGAALRTREQVSLGLIIESLMDELTSDRRGGQLTELPDVDELNRFLLMLHTGMTANPRLAASVTPSPNLMDARNSLLHLPLLLNNDRKPGTFEVTQEMRLYSAFGVPLVHGWLAPRSDPARAAFTRSAQTYEDAQTILFGEEELEDKMSRVGLTPEEQQLLQDISAIKSFLESHPTQITPYGLEIINESLFPSSCAILFRNDHFSTIYKHPGSGQLFTLVTDAGYSDKDEVIWESLADVSGQNSEFFSGDFRPVGNAEASNQPQQSQADGSSTARGTHQSTQLHEVASPISPQEQQQQADADFAMALQLQEEEEARIDDSRLRSGGNEAVPNRNVDPSNSHRLRERDGNRPAIPPRNVRNQGVNRPVDANSDDAPPPAYEEAAKGKPYLPPMGHPQHPSFEGQSPMSGPSTPMRLPGPRVGQPHPRRTSGFQESPQFHGSPPLTRPPTNNSFGAAQSCGRQRDREKDCTVM